LYKGLKPSVDKPKHNCSAKYLKVSLYISPYLLPLLTREGTEGWVSIRELGGF